MLYYRNNTIMKLFMICFFIHYYFLFIFIYLLFLILLFKKNHYRIFNAMQISMSHYMLIEIIIFIGFLLIIFKIFLKSLHL